MDEIKKKGEKEGEKEKAIELIANLAQGNPGAVTVIMKILTDGIRIDPYDYAGGFGSVLYMDSMNIRGPKVWMLYKDVCNENIVKTMAMIRATQLKIISKDELLYAIDNRGTGVDVEVCLSKVKELLPNFGKEETK